MIIVERSFEYAKNTVEMRIRAIECILVFVIEGLNHGYDRIIVGVLENTEEL